MTWDEIRRLYQEACGSTPVAQSEAWVHLSDAYRTLCSRIDDPSVLAWDLELTTVIDQDYVSSAEVTAGQWNEIWAIVGLFNQTAAITMVPEPEGFRGRLRALQVDAKPAGGVPVYYVSHGDRIYLRGTPDEEYVLRAETRFQPPQLTDADLASSPVLDLQFHTLLAAQAAAGYFTFHPADRADGDRSVARGPELLAAVQSSWPGSDRKRDELAALDSTFRVRGYQPW